MLGETGLWLAPLSRRSDQILGVLQAPHRVAARVGPTWHPDAPSVVDYSLSSPDP